MFLGKLKEKRQLLKAWQQSILNLHNLMHKLPILDKLKQRTTHSNGLVGLDIGSTSLRLLKINFSEVPYKVENFAMASIPAGIITKDEIKDYSTISTILKDMFRQSHVMSKQVALAIPRSLAIIKTVTIDSRLTEDEIESRAWIEANRHFPDLVGDIHLDFTIAMSAQDSSQLDLTLVACRKDQIKPYLEILKQAGLGAKIVDLDCYALERALPLVIAPSSLDTIALLNLNVNLSSFIVVHHNHLIHAHDQSYDGTRLLNQVEVYLKEHGIENAKDNKEILNDEGFYSILKENLISHLRHILHFFYSSRPNINIQKIILAGDCASITNLPVFIQKEIGIETILANPFEKITCAKEVDQEALQKNAAALMLCCGLALSRVE